jgi:hypothetical protein
MNLSFVVLHNCDISLLDNLPNDVLVLKQGFIWRTPWHVSRNVPRRSYFQNITRFHCTRKVNLIEFMPISTTFLAPIFAKHANAQQNHAQTFYIEFHPYGTMNTQNTDRNLFTPLWTSLRWCFTQTRYRFFCGIHPVAVYHINTDIRTAVRHNTFY